MNNLEWYNKIARMAEDDKRLGGITYSQIEIIAAFVAKEEAAQQGVQSDGDCPYCQYPSFDEGGKLLDHCAACSRPRR